MSNVTVAGECLGILGAVDPGRLEKNADLSAATNVDSIPLAVTEETFVVDLVNVLIRDHPHMTSARFDDFLTKTSFDRSSFSHLFTFTNRFMILYI